MALLRLLAYSILVVLFGCILLPDLSAQQRYYNFWYFGFEAGVSFDNGSPERIKGALKSTEGCASICNPVTGELLFYTNGVEVWNRNHAVMPNGQDLHGHPSSTQSSLIVPKPGDPDLFYIFTTYAGRYAGIPQGGLEYSVVDMKSEGGLGDVVQKNTVLQPPGDNSEKVVAVRHCNGDDYWVIAHGLENNRFYAWKVTRDGIASSPVVSETGNVQYSTDAFTIGYLKASPDGRFLFSVVQQDRSGELFPFDKLTGEVGERIVEVPAYYAASFSPNSEYLYVTIDDPKPAIYRYPVVQNGNILQGNVIRASGRAILELGESTRMNLRAMQIGPDRRIYVIKDASLGAIENPDLGGTYRDSVVVFDDPRLPVGIIATNGLPNCIDSYLGDRPFAVGCRVDMPIDADFMHSDTVICVGETVDFTDLSREDPIEWWWTFDGGEPKDSREQNPEEVRFNQPGNWLIRLVVYNGSVYDTALSTVQVRPAPVADAGEDRVICKGETVQLKASGGGQYKWTPTEGLSCDNCEDPLANPDQTMMYRLTVTNSFGCEAVDSVQVEVLPEIRVEVRPDTSICLGTDVRLSASGAGVYEWSPSTGLSCTDCPDPVARPTETTTYIVIGRGSGGGSCFGIDSVTVHVDPLPEVDAGAGLTLCAGASARLKASGATTFQWRSSPDLDCFDCAEPLVTPKETAWYYVTGRNDAGCEAIDSVLVIVNDGPVADAGEDRAICLGESLTLKASGGSLYEWESSPDLSCLDCPDPVATPEQTMTYRLVVRDAGGCEGYDSVTVVVHPLPVADAGVGGTICPGESLALQASGGVRYRWEDSPELSCLDCANPVATPEVSTMYYVTVFDENNCQAYDSVEVVVHQVIPLDFVRNYEICKGEKVNIDIPAGVKWEWLPEEGLSCTDCPDPVASPEATTVYRVTVTNSAGCVQHDSVGIVVREEPKHVRLSMADDFTGLPDELIVMPIKLVDEVPGSNIRQLRFEVEYDRSVMILDIRSVEENLAGTLLEGWTVVPVEAEPGRLVVDLVAPDGETFSGEGTVLSIAGRMYLSRVKGTDIHYTLVEGGACYAFDPDPGHAELDEICGLEFRLIESTAAKYRAPVVSPNPAAQRVRIEFGLGLDGPVELEIFDAAGVQSGILVRGYLESGLYQVEWDAVDQPSGLYYYRLSSGDWVKSGQIILQK